MSKFKVIKYKIILVLINFIRLFTFKKSNNKESFFIIGSGRNGSTLLSTILNAHKDIFIPPEQFVLPYAIMKRYVFFYKRNDFINNYIINMFSNNKKTLNWDFSFNNIEVNNKCINDIYSNIYINYSMQKGKKIKKWGDKTPLNIHFIKFIYPEFVNSKYIFLIRDVRDVIVSYKKLKDHKAKNIDFAIWKWNDSIRKLRYLQKYTNPLIIKYEDLVSNTNLVINDILHYIELPVEKNLINKKLSASDMGVGTKNHHANLNNKINSKSVGSWKMELSESDLKKINRNCRNNLIEFGYL